MTPTPLATYYDQLARHDWTYMMSDDPSVYKRGSSSESAIKTTAKQSPEHQALFDAYSAFAWGRGPKPKRPA